MKFTLHALLRSYDIDPRNVRLVRHSDKDISVADTFRSDREKFTEYTAWQRDGKFGEAKYIAVFAPARGTTALFLVLWQIVGLTRPKDLTAKDLRRLERHGLPDRWFHLGKSTRYHLAETEAMSDLRGGRGYLDSFHGLDKWISAWGYAAARRGANPK